MTVPLWFGGAGGSSPPAGIAPGWASYAGAVTTVALVSDLMDRSRIAGALAGVTFAPDPSRCAGADAVIVDLGGHAGAVAGARRAAPEARIVAFGRHDDPEALARARRDGADLAVPRSRFFRDPAGLTIPPQAPAVTPERRPGSDDS